MTKGNITRDNAVAKSKKMFNLISKDKKIGGPKLKKVTDILVKFQPLENWDAEVEENVMNTIDGVLELDKEVSMLNCINLVVRVWLLEGYHYYYYYLFFIIY